MSFFGLDARLLGLLWFVYFLTRLTLRGKTFSDFSHRRWPNTHLNRTSNADAGGRE